MSCFAEIKNWMSENFLQQNDSKSEVIIITPCGLSTSSINNLSSSLGAISNNVWEEASATWVLFLIQNCPLMLKWLRWCSPALPISVLCRFRKSHPRFYLFQPQRLQCTLFWYQQAKHPKTTIDKNTAARLLTHTKRTMLHQLLLPFTSFLWVLELILRFYSCF